MPGANRHRKPSTRLLFNRVYRQQVETQKVVKDLQAEIARMRASTVIHATVAAHCQRLLREKALMLGVIQAAGIMDMLPMDVPVLTEEVTL